MGTSIFIRFWSVAAHGPQDIFPQWHIVFLDTIGEKYRHPLVSMGLGFQDPPQITKPGEIEAF
jgi:hypothetical protein